MTIGIADRSALLAVSPAALAAYARAGGWSKKPNPYSDHSGRVQRRRVAGNNRAPHKASRGLRKRCSAPHRDFCRCGRDERDCVVQRLNDCGSGCHPGASGRGRRHDWHQLGYQLGLRHPGHVVGSRLFAEQPQATLQGRRQPGSSRLCEPGSPGPDRAWQFCGNPTASGCRTSDAETSHTRHGRCQPSPSARRSCLPVA